MLFRSPQPPVVTPGEFSTQEKVGSAPSDAVVLFDGKDLSKWRNAKGEDAKWNALIEDIVERHEEGQPILVGTVSIEKSEKLSTLLNRRGVQHHVLNAKNHEKEAMIVAQAGRKGAVTVATNMAGRGVDILLGGNPEYLARQEKIGRAHV